MEEIEAIDEKEIWYCEQCGFEHLEDCKIVVYIRCPVCQSKEFQIY